MRADIFWSNVERHDGGCWLWTGRLRPDGYAYYAGKIAHRLAYRMLVGPIPDGLELDHTCEVHRCVNPDHLEPCHPRAKRTCAARYASYTHCAAGHEYTPGNTYIKPDGFRDCRACIRDRVRRYKARRAA